MSEYKRFERTKPEIDLPSLREGGLRSGLKYDFDDSYVPPDVWLACASGRWAYVVRELDEDPNIINTADEGGATLLHWAALHGANVLVQRLLDMGHALNVLNGVGQTPFMWAAIQGRLETLDLLRQQNADMEVHDDNGATALLLSIQHKRPLAQLALLAMGASIDAVDDAGCGVAHYAASMNNMHALRILKARKFPLNNKDNQQMLPLHRAARNDAGDVVSFLVDHGNDPLAVAQGKTAREMAQERRHHHAAAKLLKAENMAKRVRGNPFLFVLYNVRAAKERDKWMWCAAWAINFMGSAVAYYTSMLPVAALYPTCNMLFVVCMLSLAVMYPILTLGDPGKVTEDTPRDPATELRRRRNGGSRTGRGSNFSRGTADEEMGLVEPASFSFVSRLTAGLEGLTRDQRAFFICFTCDHIKPLRSKHSPGQDFCVEKFDHHCVWINNAVGKNNHRMFVIFCLAKLTASILYVFFALQGFAMIWSHSVTVMHFVRSVFFIYKLMLLHMFINMIGVGATGQIVYSQFIVMAKNQLTNENINVMRYEHFWREFQAEDGRRGRRFVNPFAHESSLHNFLEFWGLKDPLPVSFADIVKIIKDNHDFRNRDFKLLGIEPGTGAGPPPARPDNTETKTDEGSGVGGASPDAVGGHGHSHSGADGHHGHSHSGGGHGHSHGH